MDMETTQLDSIREQLRSLRSGGDVEVYERVDLRAWTASRIGGLADLVIRCKRVTAAEQVLDLLASHGAPWLVLGAGSRLVAPEPGLRVPVVSLGGPLLEWQLEPDGVEAGAGTNLTQLQRSAARAKMCGLEPLLRQHGSVGGAVVAGARLGRREVLDRLDWAEVVWPGRPPQRLSPQELCNEVRIARDGRREVVTRVRLGLRRGESSRVAGSRTKLASSGLRDAAAFLEPVFEDTAEVSAEHLLERSEVKGRSAGGARVCDRNANRITTSSRANASHVSQLCVIMRDQVREHFGLELRLSLDFVDELGRRIVP